MLGRGLLNAICHNGNPIKSCLTYNLCKALRVFFLFCWPRYLLNLVRFFYLLGYILGKLWGNLTGIPPHGPSCGFSFHYHNLCKLCESCWHVACDIQPYLIFSCIEFDRSLHYPIWLYHFCMLHGLLVGLNRCWGLLAHLYAGFNSLDLMHRSSDLPLSRLLQYVGWVPLCRTVILCSHCGKHSTESVLLYSEGCCNICHNSAYAESARVTCHRQKNPKKLLYGLLTYLCTGISVINLSFRAPGPPRSRKHGIFGFERSLFGSFGSPFHGLNSNNTAIRVFGPTF